ncbi:MAG: rhodanese-like domain-containing protein [Anaeromyxobacteraceae bacterium]
MSAIKDKINAGAVIVDVRTPEEFADGAYPNAVNIPVQDLGSRAGEIPKDRPVVLYCASGARSAFAARMLKANGWTDVVNGGGLSDMP